MKKLIFVLLITLFSTYSLAHDEQVYAHNAELIRVLDGDTMDMRIDMGLGIVLEDRVRVLDYDAPETWRPRNEAEREHGKQAKERATELLQGPVTVVVHGRGSFGRVLVEIALDGHTDSFADIMKAEGLGKRSDY